MRVVVRDSSFSPLYDITVHCSGESIEVIARYSTLVGCTVTAFGVLYRLSEGVKRRSVLFFGFVEPLRPIQYHFYFANLLWGCFSTLISMIVSNPKLVILRRHSWGKLHTGSAHK